jgi:hypothetical protein
VCGLGGGKDDAQRRVTSPRPTPAAVCHTRVSAENTRVDGEGRAAHSRGACAEKLTRVGVSPIRGILTARGGLRGDGVAHVEQYPRRQVKSLLSFKDPIEIPDGF